MKREILFRGMATACLLSIPLLTNAMAPDPLLAGFQNPPDSAKPHTWWHWMNGNVTKEGITADLEAMREIGLGGAQIFDAGCNIPPGPIAYNTPAWFDVIRHAAKEARRLGLELCLPNCSGWSSSGGPWNPPENSMKMTDFTETRVKGPMQFHAKLPMPKDTHGFYEDIAVVAVPVPPAETADHENPQVTETEKGIYQLQYQKPFRATGFLFKLDFSWMWIASAPATVECSDDGKIFKPVGTWTIQLATSGVGDTSLRFYPFSKAVTAKYFRISFGIHKRYPNVKISQVGLGKKMALSGFAAKTFHVRAPLTEDVAETTPDQVVAKDQMVLLTRQMDKEGILTWEVPAGEWAIIRFGHKSTGRRNHPASKFGVGLEVDKLSASAMDFHFESYVAKLCKHLGDLAGDVPSGLNNILVDSYEVGSQNWTQGFEKIFEERMGYSLLPYLPALSGRIVGSVEETERFLWDYRRVIADLFAENYAGALAKKCHQYGLKLSLEPYGSCPSDNLQYGQDVDIPMGEFWSNAGGGDFHVGSGNAVFPAYLAHVWGRRWVGMEAFTASPEGGGRWQTTPFSIKAQGDRVYANGANRMIFHRFAHQPWVKPAYLPGMTMGRWGMHLDRTQTWWRQGKEWMKYLARCQWMLQEGTFVADVLFFCGEDAPNAGGNTDGSTGGQASWKLPSGYRSDICATAAVKKLRVVDGKIVVPGGVQYRMLVLPTTDVMSKELLQVFGRLVDQGAKVVATVKPVRAPGLRGYPKADQEVKQLADEIWKKGVLQCTAEEALKRLGVQPDVLSETPEMAWIHRRYDAGVDGYFVAMPNMKPTTASCSFRITGKQPELWNAQTGEIKDASVFRTEAGRTIVTMPFDISGSWFVLFRKPLQKDHAISIAAKTRDFPLENPNGPFDTLRILDAKYGSFPDKTMDLTQKLNQLVQRGKLHIPHIDNRFAGKDPADMIVKECRITYEFNGKKSTLVVPENATLTLPPTAVVSYPPFDYEITGNQIRAWKPLTADVQFASGKTAKFNAEVPAPMTVQGPWDLSFPSGWGAPETIRFPQLISYTEHENEGVKYFSGTATYTKTFRVKQLPVQGERMELDLGIVKNFAEVEVNGIGYPVLWKPPFRVDMTEAVLKGAGEVRLSVKVTNLWPNRLIGDDFLPEDCEWSGSGREIGIVKIPDWVKAGKPSPTGRRTFTTWKHWKKTDRLLPSGLLGPVKVYSSVLATSKDVK